MAHYAKVNNGVVENVIVAEVEFFDTFVDTSPGDWVQTSYNTRGGKHYDHEGNEDIGTPLRKNFATVGGTYDADKDVFIDAQPFGSWIFNENSCIWEAPAAYPEDGTYDWDEETNTWVTIVGE